MDLAGAPRTLPTHAPGLLPPGGINRCPQPPAAALLLAEESRDPKCFTRLQDDLTCFWETRDNLESQPELSPGGYELEYRLE